MPATGQSANAIEFSFDTNRSTVPDEASLRAAVVAGGGVDDTAPAAPAATATPALSTPATTTPAPDALSTPSSTPIEATAQPTSAEEPRSYTIKVDGRDLVVTERDLLDGHMRLKDYTQKTQRIADERRQWEAERTKFVTEQQAIDQFLRDKNALDAYYAQVFGTSSAAPAQLPQVDPNKPVTTEDVAAISRYNAEQVRLHAERLIDERFRQATAMSQQAVHDQKLAKVETEINAHISTILDKYPVLKKFEDIDEMLIADAARHKPTNVEDAKQHLVAAAERRMAVIRSIADDEKKAAAVKAAQLRKTSPEPTGGTPPTPKAGTKLTLNTRDRKALMDAAVADVQAMLDASA